MKITFHAKLSETSPTLIRSNCSLASLLLLATAVRIKLNFEIIEMKFTKLKLNSIVHDTENITE